MERGFEGGGAGRAVQPSFAHLLRIANGSLSLWKLTGQLLEEKEILKIIFRPFLYITIKSAPEVTRILNTWI